MDSVVFQIFYIVPYKSFNFKWEYKIKVSNYLAMMGKRKPNIASFNKLLYITSQSEFGKMSFF